MSVWSHDIGLLDVWVLSEQPPAPPLTINEGGAALTSLVCSTSSSSSTSDSSTEVRDVESGASSSSQSGYQHPSCETAGKGKRCALDYGEDKNKQDDRKRVKPEDGSILSMSISAAVKRKNERLSAAYQQRSTKRQEEK